jgi:predicted enzyme related to lactoylglutathione lyase
MTTPIVFVDIAGPDDKALCEFYASVFDWQADTAGKFVAPVVPPLHCAIRKDPAEKRIYLGVADVSATLSQVEAAGGSIDVPRFEVPGVVVLGLFRDPAGNAMGLVELDGNRPRIP